MGLIHTTEDALELPWPGPTQYHQVRAEDFYDLAAMLQLEGRWASDARRGPKRSVRFARSRQQARAA